jgi:hypothetical protein
VIAARYDALAKAIEDKRDGRTPRRHPDLTLRPKGDGG